MIHNLALLGRLNTAGRQLANVIAPFDIALFNIGHCSQTYSLDRPSGPQVNQWYCFIQTCRSFSCLDNSNRVSKHNSNSLCSTMQVQI